MPSPKRITFAITTGSVLVVAILAFVALALWAPPESRTELLAGGGILASVILASMRELWSIVHDGGSDQGPGAGGAAALALVIIASASPALAACTPTQWDVHAFTAEGLHDGSDAARHIIRDARADALRSAARSAEASDGDVGAAIEAAAAAWDRDHADLIDGQRALAATSTEYSSAAYAAIRGHATDPTMIGELGRQAGREYRALAAILRRHGLDGMPALPDGALDFLGAPADAPEGGADPARGELGSSEPSARSEKSSRGLTGNKVAPPSGALAGGAR